MTSNILILSLVSISSWTLIQCQTPPIGCYVSGECENYPFIGLSSQEDATSCHRQCKETSNCSYFTHYSTDMTCFAYSQCDLSVNSCQDCISGDVTCPEDLECYTQGLCLGTLIDHTNDVNSLEECVDFCNSNPDCEWWTYNDGEVEDECILTTSCQIDSQCTTCISGEQGCLSTTTISTTTTTVTPTTTSTAPITVSSTLGTTTSEEDFTCNPDFAVTPTASPSTPATGTTEFPPINTTQPYTAYHCGDNYIYADAGEIHSPNYPNDHNTFDCCQWSITVSPGKKVGFIFNDIQIEDCFECVCDHVDIRDGPGPDSPLIRRICGYVTPGETVTTSNQAFVEFTSDDIIEYRGFSLRFYTLD